MRRFFLPLFALGALLLTAATPPPGPAPRPTSSLPPLATPVPAAPSLSTQTPSVLVYPFDNQGGGDPKAGAAIATILQQQMSAAGGLRVLPVAQNVARADFLTNARKQGADFYVSGYVTPIGDAASVVEQVVSVDSGVILFSQTAQVFSVADVASQALLARAQILAFVNRGTQNIASQSTNTPAPTSTNGAQMKLGGISGIVDSVFHHHGGPTPEPTAAVKPSRGVIVAPVAAGAGTVPPADLTNASNELYFALARRYNASMTAVKSNVAQSADSICGTKRNNTVATGTIAENVPKHGREVTFTLQVYTCFGVLLDSANGKGTNIKTAIDAAVATYAGAHPDNS
ncbi:MAG: hypothetical protein JOY98_04560 [Candidatus Eremiobacteraeota bacterium]|nr:hypothetical protein [Candidatus Eremiobacteraeota bacterium]